MSIKRFGPDNPDLPFARAVQADGWLYVSGQVPFANGELVPATSRRNHIKPFKTCWPSSKKQATARSTLSAAVSGSMMPATFRRSIKSSGNTSAPTHRRGPA